MSHRNILPYVASLLLFFHTPLSAQESHTFVHTIQRGETVYSIARTYQVSPDAILQLNPSAQDGIKAGATLIIPQGTPQEKFHTIQPGETLYQLTKTYNVDADAICKANPGLTADNFQSGKVIRIPASNRPAAATAAKPAVPVRPKCKETYKVKRKETIYSISQKFGLSETELRDANPEMKAPDYQLRKGDLICIPYPATGQPKPVLTPVNPEAPSNAELLARKSTPAPKRYIRMGVILPLKGNTPEHKKMIEFYRGVLMAVEDIKKTGVSVDVFTYDAGQSAADMKAVLSRNALTELDFIIGPLRAEQIPALSGFCQKSKTRLVVPFSSQGDEMYQNPYYYAVNPPKSFLFSEAAHLTTELFGKDNLILMDGKESDDDAVAFTEAVNRRLLQNGRKMGTLQLNDTELKWLETMNQFQTNVIIPNSSSIKLLNQMFPKLKEFTKKYPQYRIKLIGYPEWQTYTSSQLENFYRFDTYAFSTFYRNPLNGHADQFDTNYQKAFHETTIASWPCFGMLGFDTAYFFLKGLSTYGDALEQHLAEVKTTPYQHQFNFQRTSNWSGFINKDTEFIHYTTAHSIELIRLKK